MGGVVKGTTLFTNGTTQDVAQCTYHTTNMTTTCRYIPGGAVSKKGGALNKKGGAHNNTLFGLGSAAV